ncbi:MAG: SpoIIE family protein phosphatase [Leptospirales bacterium]|nr:SpoIIE family protein phosphatase [Leptospirales bacterium]
MRKILAAGKFWRAAALLAPLLVSLSACGRSTGSELLNFSTLPWSAAEGLFAEKSVCPRPGEDGRWLLVQAPPINLWSVFHKEPGDEIYYYTLCTRAMLSAEQLQSIESPSLFLPGIGDNWRFYINGRLVRDEFDLDAAGKSIERHRTQMGAVVSPPRDAFRIGENILRFEFAAEAPRVSWASGGTPGFFYGSGYVLAEPAAVQFLRSEDIWLGGAFVYFAFGIYHIALFLGRRRERYLLFFGLSGISIFIYLASRSYFAYQLTPEAGWLTRIEIVSLSLTGPLLMSFLSCYMYGSESSQRSILAYYLAMAPLAVAALLVPHNALAMVVQIFLVFQLPWVALYVPYYLLRATLQRRVDAARIAIAMAVFLATALWDIVNALFKWFSINPLFQYGFFALIGYLTLLQVLRLHRVQREMDHLNQELDQKNTALLALDRLKDEFLANTSHELRTPLHGITGIADSLIEGAAGPLTPRVQDNLRLISSSARRLGSLINDILDMSRLRDGRLELELRSVNLASALQSTVDLLGPLARDSGLYLETRLEANLPHVLADEDRLQQVLNNLIGNSIKFTTTGGVRLTAQRQDEQVLVAVEDSGPGIEPGEAARIFEPFYQTSGGARQRQGAGLGLAIVRQLLELHHSQISLHSSPAGGARFEFRLQAIQPLAAEGDAPPAAGISASSAASATRLMAAAGSGGPEILIADDEPVNLQILSNILSAAGYRLRAVSDGQSALEQLLGATPPDAAILDVMMPGLSGYDVLRRLRELRSQVELPVLIVTARGGDEAPEAFDIGANDYLSKPFQNKELLARLGAALALRQAAEERGRLRALTEDLRLARKIQSSILPTSAPGVRGGELGIFYRPMHAVGGDFYDFHQLDDLRLGVLSADISGHGASAAMIAAMLKVSFSAELEYAEEPARLLSRLNRSMYGKCDNGFITASYCFFDFGRHQLRFARAGHTPLAVLAPAASAALPVGGSGAALGWRPRIECQTIEATIQSGERYYLYTDGFSEARSPEGEPFGEERLYELFGYAGALPLRDSLSFIENALERWSGSRGFEDDLSLVCVQIL